MKYLLLFLIAISLGANTNRTVVRDRSGRPIAVISDSKGRQTFRNASGQILGTFSRTGNRTLYRDASGRVIASKTERR